MRIGWNWTWLEKGAPFTLDPDLQLYAGPQFARGEKPNFGLFTDSAPDRWRRKRKRSLIKWPVQCVPGERWLIIWAFPDLK